MNEILGTLTDAEREELSRDLDRYPDARAMREDMHRVLANDEVLNYVKQQAVIHPADVIINRVNSQKRRRKVMSLAIVSAAAALILFFAVKELYRPDQTGKPVLAGSVVKKQHIQLQLSNGQTIDLNTDTSQVLAGNVVLKNANKTLTYKSGEAAGFATLTVPPGKDYTIHLSDGSEVQLNAATSIRFPLSFTGNTREVFINGEAYLKIAKDADKPFIVNLPNSSVHVLGTAFNVNTYDSGIVKVALVEGAVKFVNKENSLQLLPGQEGVSSAGNISTHPFDETEVLSWRSGRFLFSNASLEDVCRVIPRLYGLSLELDNKQVASRRFSGVIDRNQPLENVLKALKATNAIDYYADKEGVFHIK
ncbi:FecR family protein [Chitinophaga oryziterrae]|nr:FecR domain-containing protein [Chitinophaga oryziterrae]